MTEAASTTFALPDPSTIPIKALRLGTRNLISSLLNPPKIIPNDNGLPRLALFYILFEMCCKCNYLQRLERTCTFNWP